METEEQCTWWKNEDGWYGGSSCGKGTSYISDKWSFCPYCGCKLLLQDLFKPPHEKETKTGIL